MKSALIAALTAIATASPALGAAPVTGKWLTTERDSIVEIGQCGPSVCGRVLRVLKMMDDGEMPIDRHNPDPKLRGRTVQGMTILTSFADAGKNWKGRIYDPKTGKTYKSFLTRNADGTLKVQGCIGFICQSFVWTAAR